MASEKQFENKIKSFLQNKGCYFVKYLGCGYTRAGVPDLLVCCNGRFIGIEVKAENGKLSSLQQYNIMEIQKAGGIALIVKPSEFENFKNIINKLI